MRSLSGTLLAAQKAASQVPYVKVEVVDRVAGIARLNWERLYTGGEPDFHHALTLPGDGSFVRARVDSSSYQLYVQRVANPGPGSNFGSWSLFEAVSPASGIALCSQESQVLLFYVGPDQVSLRLRESNDYGASFGSAVPVATAAAPAGWMAAAYSDSGTVALFYSVGGTVYVVKRSGGSWGSPSAWSHSAADISGLACIYDGDWDLAVCGRDSSNSYKVWVCLYGDGYLQGSDTWSSLKEVMLASPDSNTQFRCPSLALPDVFRLLFVEKYTGTEAYSYPLWSHSLPVAGFAANLWREPVPFNFPCEYGLALACHGSYAWLSAPGGVWRALLVPASAELTGDVLLLTMMDEPGGGWARVELRNDDGRYGSPGSGNLAALREGSEIRISPGYRTPAGDEFSAGPAYWVEGWEHTSAGAEARLVLRAVSGWELLRRWRARRQFAWPSGQKNIFNLLSFVLARAGLEFTTLSYSSTLVSHYPAFTISPAESGATAVRRLLEMVPDVLFFRGSCAYLWNPQASDSSIYSYGTGHAIIEGRFGVGGPAANRVQVFGSGVMKDNLDWESIAGVYDRLVQVYDLNLATLAKAEERGQAEMRRAQMASLSGEITEPVP